MKNPDKTNLGILNQIIKSEAQARLEIDREIFATKLLHLDSKKAVFFIDELIPKHGNKILAAEQLYPFSIEEYNSGIVTSLKFKTGFIGSTVFGKYPAHSFTLPADLKKERRFCEVKPGRSDNIRVSFSYANSNISERVVMLGVRSIEFCSTSPAFSFLKQTDVKNVRLEIPGSLIVLEAEISRFSKYTFKLNFRLDENNEYLELNRYISDRYLEEYASVIKTDAKKKTAIPGILKKPVLETRKYKAKIMVVDDEEMVTDLISRLLDKYDYFPYAVNNPAEAIEKAARFQPDLILLDLNMPGFDGFTLCRRLKRDHSTKNIPIVMLTGTSSPEDVIDAKEAGASGYILKTFDKDMNYLVSKIDGFLN